MKHIGIFLVAALTIHCVCAGEREETYYREKGLPLVRDFIRTNHLAFDPDFATNKISHWGVEYATNSGKFLSRTMLEKRLVFFFIGDQTNSRIDSFEDKVGWPRGLMKLKPEEARAWLARPNLLNTNSARALLRETFRRLGHHESNFKPMEFEHIAWGYDVPPQLRLALPFYRGRWIRSDVKPSNNSHVPSVYITVSGVQSNLVEYMAVLLPHVPGKDSQPGETWRN